MREAYNQTGCNRDILDGLQRVGFRLNYGLDGSGFLLLAWQRGGGYYLGTPLPRHLAYLPYMLVCELHVDVGASQLIIDGKIKLKNDSQITHFTKTGLAFDNGSKLEADVVVFATGWVNH